MKKLKILILGFGLLLLCIWPAFGAIIIFSDVTGHWGESDIYYMVDKDILSGYPDGTFKPDRPVSRGEFIFILAKEANADLTAYNQSANFKDVGEHWAKAAINWGVSLGVVSGYSDNTFKANAAITRQEVASMFYRYLTNVIQSNLPLKYPEDTFNDDKAIGSWAKEAITQLQRMGLISGRDNHNFCPQEIATRAETASMVARYIRIHLGEASIAKTVQLYLNDNLVQANTPLLVENGVDLIGARVFLEALGYEVELYNQTSLLVAYNHKNDLEMWLENPLAYVNGRSFTLPCRPQLQGGATFIPLTATATNLNIELTKANWNTENAALYLTWAAVTPNKNDLGFWGTAVSQNVVNGNIFLNSSAGFFGSLTNGQMTEGSYTAEDGARYFGQWSNGAPQGQGRAISVRGELSLGTFSNGHLTEGTIYYDNYTKFTGQWYYNTATGSLYPSVGTLTTNQHTYGSDSAEWSGGALTATKW